ncbi:MAG: CinA family protein [Actinomycetota bacterium]
MADNVLPEGLLSIGAECGRLLKARGETVGVAEGSCGGLISAALLSVPGASAYYLGGTVIYTRNALRGLLSGKVDRPDRLRGATEEWALHMARGAQAHLDATWGVGEGGATGPGGNPYGDPSGHAWLAVSGPTEVARNILTGLDDRQANMVAFAEAALQLLAGQLD